MKKEKLLIIYVMILAWLAYLGYLLSIILFKFYDKYIFICEQQVELCWPQLFKSWSLWIISSIIIVVIIWYFIFKHFKKYINNNK